jgi:hypothetical protein
MTEGIFGASGLTSAAKRLYSAWAALRFWGTAAFTLVRTATMTDELGDEFRLGTFELRENISLNEK